MKQCIQSALLSTVIGLAAVAPAAAVEWVDACDLAEEAAAQGAAGVSAASVYKDVCEKDGHEPQLRSCMDWAVGFSAAFEGAGVMTQDELQAASDACEADMRSLGMTCLPGAKCESDDADTDGPAVVEPGLDDGPVMGVDTGGCGPNMECKPPSDDLLADVDGDPGADADVGGGADECGVDLECLPDPEPEEIDDALSDAGPASVADPALDLAFWDAVKDSGNPVLLRAYIEKFPSGTFVVIAQELLKQLTAPAPQTSATPDPVAQTPAQMHDEALTLLGQVFNQPVSTWNAGAEKPIALLRQAAMQGYAPSMSSLGEMYENGIGVPQEPDRALEHYLDAGRGGYLEGYYRALMLMDQFGNQSGYVDTFLSLYRADPGMAVDSLNDVSRNASVWLQRHLKDAGYYLGGLDGAFGAGSRAALQAYVTGGPKPVPQAPVQTSGAALAADIQRELARVGCYHGAIDGKWGPGTAQAMSNFNHWNGSTGDTGAPSKRGLTLVAAALAPVCGVD